MKKPKLIIGWKEWCAFPELGMPAVKAKVDTGAKTSALHAYDIKPFTKDGQKYVRFKVHPLRDGGELEVECEAPISDHRVVMSSNGEREKRYVIRTLLGIGPKKFVTEVTLTARHQMAYRMLLGRDCIRKAKFIVDPAKSCLQGKIKDAHDLYN